jgi:hypothetical protein
MIGRYAPILDGSQLESARAPDARLREHSGLLALGLSAAREL